MYRHLILICLLSLFHTACTSPKEKPATTPLAEPDLKAMIGQMVMIGFRGMEVDSVSPKIITQIEKDFVGGIILFDYDLVKKSPRRNIKSPTQVKKLITALQQKSKTPLWVAVDQEGGKVNRLKAKYGFPKIASAKYLGQLDNLDSTKHYALLNAYNLQTLGFNLNFAPVVDLDLNPKNPVIGKYERSYSDQSATVIKHAQAWIKVHDSLGVLSTLKHFPGHGSSDADSHEGFTDISAYWQAEELQPFEVLSKIEPPIGIMTAHVFNRQLDSIFPATLSKKVIHTILRDNWKFEGLIFSDDLQMKAVNKLYDFKTIVKNSILAGVDVLVFGNNLEYQETLPEEVVNLVYQLVTDGEISKERIQDSYHRIIKAKAALKSKEK
ncbi:MAG: glycoside hydrolase family 3 protein [Saprospiraceae bacterium]